MTHYDTTEASNILCCRPETIRRQARKGALRGIKVGKCWRFARSDLFEFIQGPPDHHIGPESDRALSSAIGRVMVEIPAIIKANPGMEKISRDRLIRLYDVLEMLLDAHHHAAGWKPA